MDRAEIRKIARRAEREIRNRPRKANRTLSLNDENYQKFQAICRAQGISTSETVDLLIEAYIEVFE
jgi:3-hydroxyacyl-CoA dehydrogenase